MQFCSEQYQQDKLWCSILRLFEQSASINNQLLCYWPTIHNSISKNCPLFHVLSLHFSQFSEAAHSFLLDEHLAKPVWREDISAPIYVQCKSMYRKKSLQSRILVYRVWLWYSTWAIRERQSCTQKIGSSLQGCGLYLLRWDYGEFDKKLKARRQSRTCTHGTKQHVYNLHFKHILLIISETGPSAIKRGLAPLPALGVLGASRHGRLGDSVHPA